MDVFFYTLFWWKLMGTNWWWWWWWCSSGCGGCGGCVHLMLSSVRQMMIIQFQEQNICQTCSGHYPLQANRLPEHYPLNLLRQLSNLRPWHYGHAILGVPSSKLGTNSSHGTLPMAFGNTEYIEYIHVWTFQLYNYMLVIPKGTHSWPKKKNNLKAKTTPRTLIPSWFVPLFSHCGKQRCIHKGFRIQKMQTKILVVTFSLPPKNWKISPLKKYSGCFRWSFRLKMAPSYRGRCEFSGAVHD